MFKWSRATVTRMNGSATPDSSFLRPTKVPYKVLYALLLTLIVVIIVLLLPNSQRTDLVAVSAVERTDRESSGTLTMIRDDCATFTFNTTYPLTPPTSKGHAHFSNKLVQGSSAFGDRQNQLLMYVVEVCSA